IAIDCDGDVLLIKARQIGGACHEGYRSCFFRRLGDGGRIELIAEPVFAVAAVYRSTRGTGQGAATSDGGLGSAAE
ncbi:MAG: phosphoribosyl-AMP cyclohydrolase, partial [Isosphaeraceae bacterium]